MSKKLGLDNLYKNLYTTVNKNSPSGIGKGITPSFKSTGKKLMDNPVLGSRLLSKALESKPTTSNILKTATKNAFKRSPIGRIADLTIKVGSGIGIGYNMAKEKLKTDKKSTGGETKLSPKQQKIAAAAPPPNKITGADFAALKKNKNVKKA